MPTETLRESAVVQIGGVRVGCGNLWERTYQLADGSTTSGMSARVSFGDEVLIVGVGSALTIAAAHFRVSAIEKQAGELGRVALERVP